MGCKSQEQGGSSGLAFLVHNNPADNDAPSQTALLLDYVFQLPQPASDMVSRSGEIAYADLDSRVTSHITSLKQQQAAAPASAAEAGPSSSSSLPTVQEQPRGRVGPRDVAIDRSSVCGSFGFSTDGLSLEALGNFTSCRANVAVFAGKWFYECTVLTSGIQQVRMGTRPSLVTPQAAGRIFCNMLLCWAAGCRLGRSNARCNAQPCCCARITFSPAHVDVHTASLTDSNIRSWGQSPACVGPLTKPGCRRLVLWLLLAPQIGWATIHCPFTAEEGVGDAPDSYAVDGKRLRWAQVWPQHCQCIARSAAVLQQVEAVPSALARRTALQLFAAQQVHASCS